MPWYDDLPKVKPDIDFTLKVEPDEITIERNYAFEQSDLPNNENIKELSMLMYQNSRNSFLLYLERKHNDKILRDLEKEGVISNKQRFHFYKHPSHPELKDFIQISPGREESEWEKSVTKDGLEFIEYHLELSESKIREYKQDELRQALGIKERNFKSEIFISIYKFVRNCAQTVKTFTSKKESEIRDTLLLVLRSSFSFVEAESFVSDGRTDFKITNKQNEYEYVTGELKWWRSEKSFNDAYHQAIKKHATGLEEEIYIIILNDNKNIMNVIDEVDSLIKSSPEYCSVHKLNEKLVKKYSVKVKGHELPLVIMFMNLYLEK